MNPLQAMKSLAVLVATSFLLGAAQPVGCGGGEHLTGSPTAAAASCAGPVPGSIPGLVTLTFTVSTNVFVDSNYFEPGIYNDATHRYKLWALAIDSAAPQVAISIGYVGSILGGNGTLTQTNPNMTLAAGGSICWPATGAPYITTPYGTSLWRRVASQSAGVAGAGTVTFTAYLTYEN